MINEFRFGRDGHKENFVTLDEAIDLLEKHTNMDIRSLGIGRCI